MGEGHQPRLVYPASVFGAGGWTPQESLIMSLDVRFGVVNNEGSGFGVMVLKVSIALSWARATERSLCRTWRRSSGIWRRSDWRRRRSGQGFHYQSWECHGKEPASSRSTCWGFQIIQFAYHRIKSHYRIYHIISIYMYHIIYLMISHNFA